MNLVERVAGVRDRLLKNCSVVIDGKRTCTVYCHCNYKRKNLGEGRWECGLYPNGKFIRDRKPDKVISYSI
jgi:hypothetical protein